MSKFNNLNQYRIAHNERVIELNGPEINLIFQWYNQIKKEDPLLASESSSIELILERGPIFDVYEPMLLNTNQLKYLRMWHKHVGSPVDELSTKIVDAITAAEKGEKRPDLKKILEALKQEEENAKKNNNNGSK